MKRRHPARDGDLRLAILKPLGLAYLKEIELQNSPQSGIATAGLDCKF